jgi:hypothetical protein
LLAGERSEHGGDRDCAFAACKFHAEISLNLRSLYNRHDFGAEAVALAFLVLPVEHK